VQPRKFLYRELHYFSHEVLLRSTKDGLVGEVVAMDGSDLTRRVVVKNIDWAKFCNATDDLVVGPSDENLSVQDGFEVECHISFYRTRFNFLIMNPSSQDFIALRAAVNQISMSADCPLGMLAMNFEV
jgi:hypothetical protein